MAQNVLSLEVTSDHVIPIEPMGGTATVLNVSGDTLYYADNPQVSSTTNQGSLTAGQSASFTTPQWARSASLSTVTVTITPAGGALPVTTINPVAASQPLAVPGVAGAVFVITLTQNTTLALSGAVAGFECNVDVQLTQDATGGRTVTWPGSITWIQGSAPTLPSGPGQTMLVSLVSLNGGTVWYGSYSTLLAGWPTSNLEPIYFGGVSSHPHTANSLYVAQVGVPGQVTLTGLMAQNGTATAGHVMPSIYNSAGTLVAAGAATITQAGTNVPQQYPFSAPVSVIGGAYYIGLQFDNTGQTYDAIAGSNSSVIAQGAFAAPASITVPSTLQTALIPVMATY